MSYFLLLFHHKFHMMVCRRTEGVMTQCFSFDVISARRRHSPLFLALFYLAGILFGILGGFHSGAFFLPLMHSFHADSVSIVSLICLNFSPFLLSALAVFLSVPNLLLPISFGRGFLYAFVSMGVASWFGSAGWLVRFLLLFSDTLSMPLLYCFWQRHISCDRPLDLWEVFLYFSLVSLIECAYFQVISPLWTDFLFL